MRRRQKKEHDQATGDGEMSLHDPGFSVEAEPVAAASIAFADRGTIFLRKLARTEHSAQAERRVLRLDSALREFCQTKRRTDCEQAHQSD